MTPARVNGAATARARRVAEAYAEGELTAAEVAREFGICDRTVLRAARRFRPDYRRVRRLTEVQRDEVVRLYSTGGTTMAALGRRFGVSHRTVHGLLVRREVRLMTHSEAMILTRRLRRGVVGQQVSNSRTK